MNNEKEKAAFIWNILISPRELMLKFICFFISPQSQNEQLNWNYSRYVYVNYRLLLLNPEKAMATHSSTLTWKIPWTEGPGRLQSMGLLSVGHDWATSLSLFTFMHWRRKWQPTPVFLPGESQGWRAWWAAIYGVSQSRVRLKQLSSSSSSS